MGFCLDTWRISGSNGQKWQNRASGGWTPVPAGCRCEVGAPCHARTARMARFAPATRVPRSFAARACHARSQCTVRKLRGTRAVSRRAEAVRALCALRAFLTPWSTTRCARLTWRGLRQRAAFLHYHGAGLPCIVSVHSSKTERHPRREPAR